MRNPAQITVTCSDPGQRTRARRFAARQKLEFGPVGDSGLQLCFTPEGLALRQGREIVRVDFLGGEAAHRRRFGGGRGQALARAVGIKPGRPLPDIVDATAGFARDAYVLAGLGCRLRMIEQSPLVAALVQDAIARATADPDFRRTLERGFELVVADSADALGKIPARQRPDTVYLDPMYPQRRKSAAVKKNMRLLQMLLAAGEPRSYEDADRVLLDAARGCARRRVVVKRPRGAGFLAGIRPDTDVRSRNTRYDLYFTGS